MGLIEAVQGMERVFTLTLLGLTILNSMGMVRKMEIGSHVFIKNSEEESEEEKDDPKDTSDVPHEVRPSTAATMDIKTPPPDQEVIEEPEQPSTRARDYLLRLKVEMAGL